MWGVFHVGIFGVYFSSVYVSCISRRYMWGVFLAGKYDVYFSQVYVEVYFSQIYMCCIPRRYMRDVFLLGISGIFFSRGCMWVVFLLQPVKFGWCIEYILCLFYSKLKDDQSSYYRFLWRHRMLPPIYIECLTCLHVITCKLRVFDQSIYLRTILVFSQDQRLCSLATNCDSSISRFA